MTYRSEVPGSFDPRLAAQQAEPDLTAKQRDPRIVASQCNSGTRDPFSRRQSKLPELHAALRLDKTPLLDQVQPDLVSAQRVAFAAGAQWMAGSEQVRVQSDLVLRAARQQYPRWITRPRVITTADRWENTPRDWREQWKLEDGYLWLRSGTSDWQQVSTEAYARERHEQFRLLFDSPTVRTVE